MAKIIAIRQNGKEIFDTYGECCKRFNLSLRRLLRLIDTGAVCQGYTFDYLEDGTPFPKEYSDWVR